ncbi:MAG: hypothetical protein WD227_08525, partial [Vicinamibacterales bacterium]
MIADAPQDHLRGHALVDAIEPFFDEPCTRLCDKQVKGCAPLELALGIPQPSPGALALAEYLLAQCHDARDSNHTIGFVAAQRFAPGTPMGQGPPRDDERVDFLIGQAGSAQRIDRSGRQSRFDELHQVLVRTQALDAEDRLNPLEHIRELESRGINCGRFRHGASTDGIIAHNFMASCHGPSKHRPFPAVMDNGVLREYARSLFSQVSKGSP